LRGRGKGGSLLGGLSPPVTATVEVMNVHKRTHLLVLALYTALALGLTWPLVSHLSTHVPGSYTWAFDEYTFVWNTWWLRHALFDLGQNPLYSSHIFYPLGISLVLYTYNLFNALLSLPFQSFLSLPAISNLTFLLATVLSGYGTFLLVEYLLRPLQSPTPTARPAPRIALYAAFLAGLVYAFGSYRLVYAAIGHYDMWSTEWIPFYALFLLKTLREPRWRNAVLAGLFLVLAMLCEMIFGVFLGMLTLVVLAFALARRRHVAVGGDLRALLARLVVLGLVATLLYAPLLVPILREMFGGYELAGWGDAEKLSVDLMGMVTPTALHPLGGEWSETLRQVREGTARFRDVNTLFLGWAGLALAVVGAIRYRRRLAAWIASAVLFAVLSLGPLLQVNGRTTFDLDGLMVNVPLPFILLHYVPLVKANRVPNRFSVVLVLALAVLIGFGAHWLLRQVAGSRRQGTGSSVRRLLPIFSALLLAAMLLFEHWSVPLPLTDARIPPVYDQIAADPADFALLQLPLGWRNSFGVQGTESTQTQYYQTYHHKRLLSGNISRNPPFKFDYFRQVPILESLITIETYGQVEGERRLADQATAAGFVSFYDIRYVVVAPGVAGRPPYVDTREASVAYIEQVLPVEKVYDRDGWLLYRVNPPPARAAFRVDVGSSQLDTTMALGEGWAGIEDIQGVPARWTIAQGARVFLPAASGMDHALTLDALPFEYPGAPAQEVNPYVNGHRLEAAVLSPGWASYAWVVPARFLHQGLNDVRFEFDYLAAPTDVLPSDGAIGATGLQTPVAIEVNSGGPAGFAYISVGDAAEAQDGSVHRPGYNLAVIHPRTGKVLDRRGFDTTPAGGESEAAALAAFVAAVPDGHIVVAALQGDGADRVTDAAVAAFRAIGGQADPRPGSGWSHAIVGVKGAAPGTALEAAGPEPTAGWLRVAPDRRTLAIAVDAVTWEPAGEAK
jgi:hypothetical protein